MIGPTSYKSLRLAVKQHFGIKVQEECNSDFARYGSLMTGWIDNRGCPLVIHIRATLPGLKYIVLAHELAHFTLHFPLLYCGQLIEQLAWSVPELELAYYSIMMRHLHGDPTLIEHDANIFASYFLIPPRYDLTQWQAICLRAARNLVEVNLLGDSFNRSSLTQMT